MSHTRETSAVWTIAITSVALFMVSLDNLVGEVRAIQDGRDQPVVIEADKGARYEDVIGILDRLQRGGVKKVGLLARPSP